VCALRIACNSVWRDAEGDVQERPNYFDVSIYGGAADSVNRYLHRGSRVGVDGRLEWREWETAEQHKRQAVSIVADTVQFLDGPGERTGEGAATEPDGEGGELAAVGSEGSEEDLAF
jgi:single-strand DNA-binding protein